MSERFSDSGKPMPPGKRVKTRWHGVPFAWHGVPSPVARRAKPLKTSIKTYGQTGAPLNATKSLNFNDLVTFCSVLRQVCTFRRNDRGSAEKNDSVKGNLWLANACGSMLILFLLHSPACAEGWQNTSSGWASNTAFVERGSNRQASVPSPRRTPGWKASAAFSQTGKQSAFKLDDVPTPAARRTFVMPSEKDDFVRLRALIQYAESPRAGYDAYHHSARVPPPNRPSVMSLKEVFLWINDTPGQHHAIGRYQIIPQTLRDLVRRTGLHTDAVFSPALQDSLANVLILDAGYVEFLQGSIPLPRFMDNLAGIWAGLPLASGKSAYHGVAGNRATISRKFYEAQMVKIFGAESTALTQATPTP